MNYEEVIHEMHIKLGFSVKICEQVYDIYIKNNELDKLIEILKKLKELEG